MFVPWAPGRAARTLLFVLFLANPAIAREAAAAQPAPFPLGDGKRAVPRDGGVPRIHLPPRVGDDRDAATDVLHYLLDIEVIPQNQWIGGSNTMTVRSLVDGLMVFRFRLDERFDISSLRVGATDAAWTQIDAATVEVTLDRAYAVGEEFELYVAYSGNPYAGGMGSVTMGFRPPGVWFSYTLSEPWFAYTWWPAKDDLRDKTTADLCFTVGEGLAAASNGALQGIDDMGLGRHRYRWRTLYPTADYLYCYGIDNYTMFGEDWTYAGHTMPLRFFIRPESDTPQHRASWLATSQMLTTYSDLFGIYPFVDEKYGMLEWDWFGGMEHQTMTSIVGGDFGFYWETGIAHELAHQWWGDAVTCATWHDIWLNEGFADYAEALWAQFKPGGGEAALHEEMAGPLRPGNVDGTVYCYDIADIDRIFDYDLTYRKAGWVLHMLRHVLGETAFFDGLRAYRAEFEGGSATTADLQGVFESVAGRDLEWFFQEWVYEPGAPSYEYGWRQFVIDSTRYVEIFVRQVQPPGDPTFSMPVDIEVSQVGGATHAVWNDARAEHLLLPVAIAPVTSIALDPIPWILRRGASPVSFEEGPPKVVSAYPAPGDTAQTVDVTALEVVFHKDVAASGDDFVLTGELSGGIACAFAYDPDRHAVTLTPSAPLGADSYTLVVADAVRDVASGQALDGETTRPEGGEPLPSGDGLAGGNAAIRFVLTIPELVDGDGRTGQDTLTLAATPSLVSGPTTLAFVTEADGRVRLAILSPNGRVVRTLLDQWLPRGARRSPWNGADDGGRPVPSGVYFARLQATGLTRLARITVIR